MIPTLTANSRFFVKQTFELAEIFSFETRNKYRVTDETGQDIAYAAEQQSGILDFLFRQFLGHWRTFDIHFFGVDRQPFMIAHHPFRWFFQRLELRDMKGRFLGAVQRRFSILTKRFDVEDERGRVTMEVSSPIWKIWTFPFVKRGHESAKVSKKWSGLGYELFTDRDTFLVEYNDSSLTLEERALILAASLYIDLLFFEAKGNGGAFRLMEN